MADKENIQNVNMNEQARIDSQAYAIYVARNRAIPDFEDGLKPVIRKILWCAAHDFKNQGFIKTANVVGQVMRKYNPHGDAGVNSAIRNMINDFSTKYPIMEGSGSWGTKVDPYAAQPRYNECKISQFALDVFIKDINEDKRATDWMNNYDNKCVEPVYLPSRIPTLLILGQMGIAVGIKSTVPSHNLGDVIDITIKLMKDPNTPFTLIPDECMPCEIIDTDWQKINETGQGSYIAQGIIDIGEYNNNPCLIVRSLPDFTFYDKIDEKIRELAKNGKMPFITDLISRSGVDKKDPRKYNFEEIIVLKKGTDPNFVKEFLYTNTGIRQTRQVNLIMIKNNNLATMGYRQYLLEFIQFRRMSVMRKLNAKLQILNTRLHETELYIKLLTSGEVDAVIKMIRKNKSNNKDEITQFLCDKLKVTMIQAKYLAGITLPELSKGYLEKCKAAVKSYEVKKQYILSVLLDPTKIDDIIIDEMLEIKNKYNDKKKCWVISQNQLRGIAPGQFNVIITKNNFVKKININEQLPPSQMGMVILNNIVDNADNLIVFSNQGKAFKLQTYKIPISEPSAAGTDIRTLNKYCTSPIIGMIPESTLNKLSESNQNYIFMVSRQGYIKSISLNEMVNTPPSGLIYSRVEPGDEIESVLFGPLGLEILLYTKNKVIRMDPREFPLLRRSTKGSRVSTASTIIDGMNFIIPKTTDLVVVTKNGFVNRIPLNVLNQTSRGKAGSQVIKLVKGDSIHQVWSCNPYNKLIVREGRGQKEIPVETIQLGTTVSPGIKMFVDVNKVILGS